MRSLLICSVCLLLLSSCNWMKTKTKEVIHESGDAVTTTATEFVDGISEKLEYKVELSAELQESGITLGNTELGSTSNAKDNKLEVYLSFNNGYAGNFLVKAYTPDGLEMGRLTYEVAAAAGDAGYHTFTFDKRTSIGLRSKVTIEKL